MPTISADMPRARQAKPENANNENMFSVRYSGWFSIQIKDDSPLPTPLSVKKQNQALTAVVILHERLFSLSEQKQI